MPTVGRMLGVSNRGGAQRRSRTLGQLVQSQVSSCKSVIPHLISTPSYHPSVLKRVRFDPFLAISHLTGLLGRDGTVMLGIDDFEPVSEPRRRK